MTATALTANVLPLTVAEFPISSAGEVIRIDLAGQLVQIAAWKDGKRQVHDQFELAIEHLAPLIGALIKALLAFTTKSTEPPNAARH